MNKLRFVDTFAGIGGFHIGIENTIPDSECVAFIEIDKGPRAVYNKNFNQDGFIVEFHDIMQTDENEVPDHDILCGGFPCQAFSINKQNANKSSINTDDERTYLYKDLARIAAAKQPKYLFFENVANLSKIKKHDGTLMINDICKTFEDIGYKLDRKVYDAADFGVPQQRKRVYIIGKRQDLEEEIVWPKPNASSVNLRSILEDNVDESLHVDMSEKVCTSRCFHKDHETKSDWMNSERYYCNKSNKDDDKVYKWVRVGNTKKFVLKVTDQKKEDMVWQNKQQAFKESVSNKDNKNPRGRYVIKPESILMYDTPSGLSRQHERIYSVEGISRTLATFGHPMYDVDGVIRKLSARESARCQGFPDSFKCDDNHGKACKQFGNAVCVKVIEAFAESNFK